MNKFIKRTDMKNQKRYKVVIDRREYTISTNFITGEAIKRIAGITEKDDQIASKIYSEKYPDPRNDMGWYAFILVKNGEDIKLEDSHEVDLENDDMTQREFFTACNGTYLID